MHAQPYPSDWAFLVVLGPLCTESDEISFSTCAADPAYLKLNHSMVEMLVCGSIGQVQNTSSHLTPNLKAVLS